MFLPSSPGWGQLENSGPTPENGDTTQFGISVDTVLSIPPVRVVASRNREIIAPKRLQGAELQRLNSLSVADALRYFTGVQLKDYGGVGGLKTVNIRALGSQHVGVFYDGIQLGNAQNGQVDLGKYSLDNVEAISLYHGQRSELFQSARDFGAAGSIYIRTRRPQFAPGETTHLSALVRGGSFGLINPSVRFEHQLSKTVTTSFGAEWTHAHGRYKFRYRRVLPAGGLAYDTTAVRENGNIDATRLEGGFYGRLPGGSWQVGLYHYTSERGMPGAIVSNVFKRGERLWDRNSFIQGQIRTDITPWYRAQLSVKYAHDYTNYRSDDIRMMMMDRRYMQDEIYLSTAHLFKPLDWLRASVAYDAQYNTLEVYDLLTARVPPDFPGPSRWTQYVATALALEWGGLKTEASILGTFARNKSRAGHTAPNRQAYTPAIFLAYNPWEPLGLTLRAFAKRSYRMPTFNDLYYTEVGSANLRPEAVQQYDMGLSWQLEHPAGWLHQLECATDIFYNQVWDKIIAYPRGQQFRWTMMNLGYVEAKGIDANLNLGLMPSRSWRVHLMLQYSYQEAVDRTNPKDSFYGHQIPYIPWHSGSVALNIMLRGWSLSYSFIYAGARYGQQENIIYNFIQPWYTHDISLFYEQQLAQLRLRAGIELNNLLGQDYEVILNYPMPRQNVRGVLRVTI